MWRTSPLHSPLGKDSNCLRTWGARPRPCCPGGRGAPSPESPGGRRRARRSLGPASGCPRRQQEACAAPLARRRRLWRARARPRARAGHQRFAATAPRSAVPHPGPRRGTHLLSAPPSPPPARPGAFSRPGRRNLPAAAPPSPSLSIADRLPACAA